MSIFIIRNNALSAKRGTRTTEVDEYLARVPAGARATLEKLRTDIKAVIPTAAEVISYP